MNNHDKYFHWLWGENKLRDDEPEYLVNLEHGVSIRFDMGDAYDASYEDFYGSIADVQFLSGQRPDKEKLEEILTDAWNYLCLEERKLDEFDDDED